MTLVGKQPTQLLARKRTNTRNWVILGFLIFVYVLLAIYFPFLRMGFPDIPPPLKGMIRIGTADPEAFWKKTEAMASWHNPVSILRVTHAEFDHVICYWGKDPYVSQHIFVLEGVQQGRVKTSIIWRISAISKYRCLVFNDRTTRGSLHDTDSFVPTAKSLSQAEIDDLKELSDLSRSHSSEIVETAGVGADTMISQTQKWVRFLAKAKNEQKSER